MLRAASLVLLISALVQGEQDPYQFDDTQTLFARQTMVHLFEWKWADIASECENFLQYYGYGAVQVSPPNEHIMLYIDNDVPWYVRYQPVSYRLYSRSGDLTAFKDMVDRCNKVGVRIIVDAVLNHMVGVSQKTGDSGVGTSGTSTFDGRDGIENFPAVPYDKDDFHDSICDHDIQDSDYTNNADNVRNCRLVGLLDLNQRSSYVQIMIKAYLNTLTSYGVAGFRFDAAKHMYPSDLETILEGLNDLRSDIFGANQRPFVVHEVIDHGGEAVQCSEYVTIGRYTDFNYGDAVSNAIWRKRDISGLADLGPGFEYGNMEDHDILAFIDNHDNQRDEPPSVITYKDGDLYRLAVSYMLAWPYGYPRVMSSYNFSSHDQGPPNEGSPNYTTKSPIFNNDETCSESSGWVCEHRWPTMRQMALFRANTQGNAAVEVVKGSNRLAFALDGAGYYAINNNDAQWSTTVDTTLPAGTYCDQYNGELSGRTCTGTSITVDSNGKASLSIAARTAVAFSLMSRIGGDPTPTVSPTSTYTKTVIFLQKDTQPGENVFIRGGSTLGHSCSSGPYQQSTDACAIPIVHNSTVPWMYDEYLSWSEGDEYLDFEGSEKRQGTHDGQAAQGTPLAYSTNDPNSVDYQPLNKYGAGYWFVQLLVDCDKAESGWFEFKGYMNGYEGNIAQSQCGGSLGGTAPLSSINHIAKCGAINVFKWGSGTCTINSF